MRATIFKPVFGNKCFLNYVRGTVRPKISRICLYSRPPILRFTKNFSNFIQKNAIQDGDAEPKFSEEESNSRKVNISIEKTPNEDSIKFELDINILPDGISCIEFLNKDIAKDGSPLAEALFKLQVTHTVFFGKNFITVSKYDAFEWSEYLDTYYEIIRDFVASGKPIIHKTATVQEEDNDDVKILSTDSETVIMIKQIIETRVRPAINQDGGDIRYLGFDNGTVKVSLRGSCRTCESAVDTLNDGIERMLKYYVPNVTKVVQVLTEVEQNSLREFRKFEESKEKKQI